MTRGRRAGAVLGLAGTAALMVALLGSTSGAQPVLPHSLTIKKVVVETAPAGATFTVHVTCTTQRGSVLDQDVTFDAQGNATSTATLQPLHGAHCTVTETGTGSAASVGYACAVTSGTVATCGADGQSVDYVLDTAQGSDVTVTVTNTFVPPPLPPPPVVEAQPVFTG
jgi:Domain of unknown function (DUF5979)